MLHELKQISFFLVNNNIAVFFFALLIGGITYVYKLFINRQPILEITRHIKEKEKESACIVLSSNYLIYLKSWIGLGFLRLI